MCRRKVEPGNEPFGVNRIKQPIQRFSGAAPGIEDTLARVQAESRDGAANLRFGECIEELQFARVVACFRVTEESGCCSRPLRSSAGPAPVRHRFFITIRK
jgi:hypothetical protein